MGSEMCIRDRFINAIRGLEEITHTDFTTATRYMEWTDAVTVSMQKGELVPLPLSTDLR